MRRSGVRCTKCGAEVSHIVPEVRHTEEPIVEHENRMAATHDTWCGPTVRFEEEEADR